VKLLKSELGRQKYHTSQMLTLYSTMTSTGNQTVKGQGRDEVHCEHDLEMV